MVPPGCRYRAQPIAECAHLCTIGGRGSRNAHSAARSVIECAQRRAYRAAVRQEDRLGLILRRINEQGSVGVAALAAELDVSEASVRRDLHLLESQKLL